MKTKLKLLFPSLFILTLFLGLPIRADQEDFHISDDLHYAIQEGLHELYNLNYDKALVIFDAIEDQAEDHPMVSFGISSSHWWRISALVLETDPEQSKPFLAAVERCMTISQHMIDNGDPTGEGHLVLGGALGLLGRWEATNHNYMSAYFKGKKAYKYLTQAIKINPKLNDAYMGLGLFDYFVATLPGIVRNLAFIGMGNDPSVGLRELEKAAYEGTYSKTPSKLFLCQVYAQQENKPEKALEILNELIKEYPKSPFMHMLQIITFYNKGDIASLKSEAENFQKKVDSFTYPHDFQTDASFAMGAYYFRIKDWKNASDHFEKAINTQNKLDPWWTWALLYQGYCLDMLNKREESKGRYNQVISELRRWGSWDNAKDHLKKPFTGTDKEVAKLEL